MLLDAACTGKVPFACTNAGDLDAVLASKVAPAAAASHFKNAIAHYRQGCEAGDPTACRQIGVAYLEARGLPRSTSAAVVWLERGCFGEDGPACRILGSMMMVGTGITVDRARGQALLERGCAAKDDESCRLVKLGGSSSAAAPGADAAAGAAVDSGAP
jgi:TPR repeat protein